MLALLLWLACAHALLLHRAGTGLTPLQMSLMLGGQCEQTGRALMASLDVFRCFAEFRHLMGIRTLHFRRYYQAGCKTLSLDSFLSNVVLPCKHQDVDLVELVGLECLQQIKGFGHVLTSFPFGDTRITSRVTRANISTKQLRKLHGQVMDTRRSNILSTGFICLEKEAGAVRWLERHAEPWRFLDGPFMRASDGVAAGLLSQMAVLVEDGLAVHLNAFFALGDPPPEQAMALQAYLYSSYGLLDVAGRVIQLGVLAVWGTTPIQRPDPRCRVYLNKVNKTFAMLAVTRDHLHADNADSNGVLRVAIELVGAFLRLDGRSADLAKVLAEEGLTDLVDFYQLVEAFSGTVLQNTPTTEVLDLTMRIRIETLVLLQQLGVPASQILGLVERLLQSRLGYLGAPLPCRYLLSLLWALSTEGPAAHPQACQMLMRYIQAHMNPGSDTSVFAELGLTRHMGAGPKYRMLRLQAPWVRHPASVGWLGEAPELLHLVRLATGGTRRDIAGLPAVHDQNGYLDIEGNRCIVWRLLVAIVESHFVYCEHDGALPVYIQSLSCHPYVNRLFLDLLLHANALRLRLPFALHPAMAMLMLRAHSRAGKDYLQTAFRHEFSSPGATALQLGLRARRVFALIRQVSSWEHCAGLRACQHYEMQMTPLMLSVSGDACMAQCTMLELHHKLRSAGRSLIKHGHDVLDLQQMQGVEMAPGEAVGFLLNRA